MILAKPRGGVAIVFEHPANRRLVLRDDAVVTGEPGRLLGDHAEARGVMVSPGNQRGTSRRTKRGRVNIVIAQSVNIYTDLPGVIIMQCSTGS